MYAANAPPRQQACRVLEAEPVVALQHRTSRVSDPRYTLQAMGGHIEMAQG